MLTELGIIKIAKKKKTDITIWWQKKWKSIQIQIPNGLSSLIRDEK